MNRRAFLLASTGCGVAAKIAPAASVSAPMIGRKFTAIIYDDIYPPMNRDVLDLIEQCRKDFNEAMLP